MNNYTDILSWATHFLNTHGYSLTHPPEIVLETPWSSVIRFETSTENFYLKQTPATLAMEASVTKLFSDKFKANVPEIIAIQDQLHCFLMKDAGLNLRKYLKTDFKPELMVKAIQQYTAMQRSTENDVEAFIALGVPDWRMNNIPKLYENIIHDIPFLKAENIADNEIKLLQKLNTKVFADCERIAQLNIPETIVQYDFNTNNMLYNPITQKMTSIDLGEIVITHPFLSLQNFLIQAITHEKIKEGDAIYQLLYDSCFEHWLTFTSKQKLEEAFGLIKKLWPLYSALAFYRLMHCVDPKAFKAFYAHKPDRLAGYLREYQNLLNT